MRFSRWGNDLGPAEHSPRRIVAYVVARLFEPTPFLNDNAGSFLAAAPLDFGRVRTKQRWSAGAEASRRGIVALCAS